MTNKDFLMTHRIILLCLILAALSSCFKTKDTTPQPDLPPLSTEGKNTFGCYINGEPWKHGVPGLNLGGATLKNSFQSKPNFWNDSLLSIRAWKYYENNIYSDLIHLMFYPNEPGVFPLIIFNQNFRRSFVDFQKHPTCIYNIDTTQIYQVNLHRFDLEERIASGTFEMTLYNTTTCNDTLVITDGRFDVRFLIE